MSLLEKYPLKDGWKINQGQMPDEISPHEVVDVVLEGGTHIVNVAAGDCFWSRSKQASDVFLWRSASWAEERVDIIGQNGGDGEHYDLVTKPSHYMIIPEKGVEAKHISKALLDRMDANSFELSSFGKSCWKEALQYLLRFDMKNGKEDVEKAIEYLGIVVEEMDDDSSN